MSHSAINLIVTFAQTIANELSLYKIPCIIATYSLGERSNMGLRLGGGVGGGGSATP